MHLKVWLLLLIGLPLLGFTQEPLDSLNDLLFEARQAKRGDRVASFLSHIGYYYLTHQQYDSALYYIKASLNAENRSLDPVLNASSLNSLGALYTRKGFPDSSIHYYEKALDLYNQMKDTINATSLDINLSIIYKEIGQYEKALEIAFEAMTQLERIKHALPLSVCYNTVGNIYFKIGDYSNSLIYFSKALHIALEIDYPEGIGQAYTNKGLIFIRLHQYDSALISLLQSEEIKRKVGDKNALGVSLNLLGEVYLERNELMRAESYFIEAQKIKTASGERMELVAVLHNLAKLRLAQVDYISAGRILNEAEQLARQIGALDYLRQILEQKINLYKALNRYSLAFIITEELMIIKDSLLNKDKAESLIALQTRYETEKKEQQIYLLEQDKVLQQIELKSKQNWIATLIITIGMATIIALLLLIGYKSSQRNKTKVETLLKELHHRVKNNLQILSSLLGLQAQYIKDEDAVLAIKSNESRVNTMALIHRKLYKDDNYSTIDLKEYISELCTYLLHTYGFTEKVQVNLTSEPILIDVDKAIPVGLIMNEWIGNALKHAYAKEPSPQLNISLRVYHQKELEIKVGDNGMGMPIEKYQEDYQSFGLKMVNILIRELKGKLEVNTKEGTNYTLQLPLT